MSYDDATRLPVRVLVVMIQHRADLIKKRADAVPDKVLRVLDLGSLD